MLFISIVLFFPPIQPVTPQNMYETPTLFSGTGIEVDMEPRNYASVVVVFIALFALSWWWLSARR